MFSVFIYYKLLLFWTYLYTYLGYFCEIRERGITLLKDINIFNFITDFPPSIVAVYMPTKNNNWLFFFLIHTFISFSISLNPCGVQHYTAPVPCGLGRKVASEFWHKPCLFPWAQVTFPQIPLVLFSLAQESLYCSLLCTHKHIFYLLLRRAVCSLKFGRLCV